MKVHKVTILIVDTDGLGAQEVKETLQNANFPNDCIYPQVMDIQTEEVVWSDEHPLNHCDTQKRAFEELFPK